MRVGGCRPFDRKVSHPLRCSRAYKLAKSALTGLVVQSPAIELHGAAKMYDWHKMRVAREQIVPQLRISAKSAAS